MMLPGRWRKLFVNIFRHVDHSSRLPRASSDCFPTFVSTSQAILSPNFVRRGVHDNDDIDADGDVGGVAILQLWRSR